LLDASSAAGVSLCGGGYRDPQAQIELRKSHCGTSQYAIYEMPSSQCSPPTARPGSSMHEQGLAIDFTCNGGGTVSRGSSCWNWLSANANSYALFNLPSESWHWSTNGN
ncbi:MAG: M15 family metallopeptidase, partial [Acidimicrobiales bacterium]|nr:M15 family metallopeptidase [Acidimicrobiales bacterium]